LSTTFPLLVESGASLPQHDNQEVLLVLSL